MSLLDEPRHEGLSSMENAPDVNVEDAVEFGFSDLSRWLDMIFRLSDDFVSST